MLDHILALAQSGTVIGPISGTGTIMSPNQHCVVNVMRRNWIWWIFLVLFRNWVPNSRTGHPKLARCQLGDITVQVPYLGPMTFPVLALGQWQHEDHYICHCPTRHRPDSFFQDWPCLHYPSLSMWGLRIFIIQTTYTLSCVTVVSITELVNLSFTFLCLSDRCLVICFTFITSRCTMLCMQIDQKLVRCC
jgi:hypothetical protein